MWGTRTTLILALATATLAAGVATAVASGSRASGSYTIWRIGGNGHRCSAPPACSGNGTGTGALLGYPEAVSVARDGTVYFADYGDDEVRKISPEGKITLIAGIGVPCRRAPHCGDGHSALSASLTAPSGVVVDGKGNVYIADTGDNEIRMVTPKGIIERVAGTGSTCAKPPKCGDGGAATSAQLTAPSGIALDRHRDLYIADTGDNEIRRVATAGTITRVAGTGSACAKPPACGNGAAATSAQLSSPEGVAVNPSGIYVADGGDQQVRRILKGTISVVAGTGTACASPPSCGDGGPAAKGQLNFPDSVAVGAAGNVIIADAADNEIRLVSKGTITRVAGNGTACGAPPSCNDNQSGSNGRLDYPNGVAVDGRGDIYIADAGDNEVRFLSRAHVAHIAASGGSVALAEFAAAVRKTAVLIRYVTGAGGSVSLTVSGGGHSAVVARGHPPAGLARIVWNRHLRGHPAPSGRYKLTLKETVGGHSGSVVFHVHL
jgi:sugar lactone lactonase YvrE